MRRVFLSLIALLSALQAGAGEPYFCTTPGRTLYYERYAAGGGRLQRTTTLQIGNLSREGEASRMEYSMTLRRSNGDEMFGGAAPMTVEIDARGDVRMDLGGSLKAVLHNIFPNAEMRSEGTPALLPAGMRPGDALPEARCVVDVRGMKYRIDVTERSVLRKERLDTPAGTFDCMVVREHKVERGPGRNRDTFSDSWYVPGLGYVRHDTYDRNLRLISTELLKKY